jgi:hypothetical protein
VTSVKVEPGLIAACHDDRIALVLKLSRQFEADAAGPPGDQDGLVLQFHGAGLPFLVVTLVARYPVRYAFQWKVGLPERE